MGTTSRDGGSSRSFAGGVVRVVLAPYRLARRFLGDIVAIEMTMARRGLAHAPAGLRASVSRGLGLDGVVVDRYAHRGAPQRAAGRLVLGAVGLVVGVPLYGSWCVLSSAVELISVKVFNHNLAEPKALRGAKNLRKARRANQQRGIPADASPAETARLLQAPPPLEVARNARVVPAWNGTGSRRGPASRGAGAAPRVSEPGAGSRRPTAATPARDERPARREGPTL